jgi:O-antigen/teichoic acid export membrane protein
MLRSLALSIAIAAFAASPLGPSFGFSIAWPAILTSAAALTWWFFLAHRDVTRPPSGASLSSRQSKAGRLSGRSAAPNK